MWFSKLCIDLLVRIGGTQLIGRQFIRLAKLFSKDEKYLLVEKDATVASHPSEGMITKVVIAGIEVLLNKTSNSGMDATYALKEITDAHRMIALVDNDDEVGIDEDKLLLLCEIAISVSEQCNKRNIDNRIKLENSPK